MQKQTKPPLQKEITSISLNAINEAWLYLFNCILNIPLCICSPNNLPNASAATFISSMMSNPDLGLDSADFAAACAWASSNPELLLEAIEPESAFASSKFPSRSTETLTESDSFETFESSHSSSILLVSVI